ncbi:hypothetical protein M9H77_04910 [Catharanthus roseus]|uniref:Uncharacterized protein n=1 Tax=Catharanthus roseus TaxID=4058 RepID=A0ACC0CFS6_CATRO|nr:hypothetical protein M9H77_04910 [Catharanthus roseus]
MAFRGRGRGRGGFGGGFRIAKQVPFELFPEIEELGTAAGVKENISLAIWFLSFRSTGTSLLTILKMKMKPQKVSIKIQVIETQRAEIERFSDRKSEKTRTKPPLSHFIRMEPDYVPAELAKGEKREKCGVKRMKWTPDADMRRLDVFEKLEQKYQGQGADEKENEEEEGDENAEEEEQEHRHDGDYNQNRDFDDDEDDFNMADDNDGMTFSSLLFSSFFDFAHPYLPPPAIFTCFNVWHAMLIILLFCR